jgi:hypothetical protein
LITIEIDYNSVENFHHLFFANIVFTICLTSGIASIDNWRGEYSYIHVDFTDLKKQLLSKEINSAEHDI